jgi:hypothetical protein
MKLISRELEQKLDKIADALAITDSKMNAIFSMLQVIFKIIMLKNSSNLSICLIWKRCRASFRTINLIVSF